MRAVSRLLDLVENRTGLISATRGVLRHAVPRRARWGYVFGSATLVAFLIQVITGIALAALYEPSPDLAFESLKFITEQAMLGRFIRGVHSWAAGAMVVLVGIHLVRVVLSAAYRFPREANWMTGVVLLLLTTAMAFTGQILRWDDNGVWSTVVLIRMVARLPLIGDFVARFVESGAVLSAATLSHFFTYHVFIIPALVFLGIGLHLYLVLRHGIAEPPDVARPAEAKAYRAWYRQYLDREGVPFFPNAIWRDAVFAVFVVAAVVVLAIVVGPPQLTQPPSPANLDAVPRPDWYFMWLFAAMALLPPALEFWIVLGGGLLVFLFLFMLPLFARRGARTIGSRPWAAAVLVMLVTMIGALTVRGFAAPWSPRFDTRPLTPLQVGDTAHEVQVGGRLFYDKGCQYCHTIAPGIGGSRGPDLTTVGERLSANELLWRISNGGVNMPAFAGTLTRAELDALVVFLQSRRRVPGGAVRATSP